MYIGTDGQTANVSKEGSVSHKIGDVVKTMITKNATRQGVAAQICREAGISWRKRAREVDTNSIRALCDRVREHREACQSGQ